MEKNFLAIFDLDGTLFDTREVNYYAYKEALAVFEVGLDKDFFLMECNGRHYTEFLPQIMGSKKHVEDVHRAKKNIYASNLHMARENRHLFEMIKVMAEVYHTAIVTTASRKNVTDILKYFSHEKLFEFIVTQEDTTRIKPNPQGFVLAMDYFGASSDRTVIFEDSKVGIEAARATGATVMVINKF